MKHHKNDSAVFDDYLGCFGNFSLEDDVCSKRCALALRCVIELDQKLRLEVLNDMMQGENVALKLQ